MGARMQTENTITTEAVRDIVTLLALAYKRHAVEQHELIGAVTDPESGPLDKADTSSRHVQ
jgi:hypothetical protein